MELFSCILHLIPLVIVPRKDVVDPDAFVSVLEQYHVTRLTVVPSLLRNILFIISVSVNKEMRLPMLAMWICNSETLSPDLGRRFFDTFNNGSKVLANFYGCTETMADVTYDVYTDVEAIEQQSKENNLSIGQPMFNNVIYIVNDDLNIVKPGKIGEICVSGLNVARCYIDGDLQNNCFVSNKFVESTTEHDENNFEASDYSVLYKTGDFGRIVNGRLIYEGRRDMQVKVNGMMLLMLYRGVRGSQNSTVDIREEELRTAKIRMNCAVSGQGDICNEDL